VWQNVELFSVQAYCKWLKGPLSHTNAFSSCGRRRPSDMRDALEHVDSTVTGSRQGKVFHLVRWAERTIHNTKNSSYEMLKHGLGKAGRCKLFVRRAGN